MSWAIAVSAALCLLASACSSTEDPPLAAPAAPVSTSAAHSAPPAAPPPLPAPAVSTTQAPAVTPGGLQADFAQLKQRVGGRLGVVITPVGKAGTPIVLGDWTTGVAWSTSKVPLAIAALRNSGGAALTSSVNLAITQSDNAAADVLWRSLGDGAAAARNVDAVLREGHDSTTVTQGQVVRPGFSAFGQTVWSLQNQAQFTSALPCMPDSSAVLAQMANISASQQWGVGTIPGARFKGGWGPGASGGYLVRQLGIINVRGGQVAIAVATEPSSGSFEGGTQVLSQLARVIQQHSAELPAGTC